MVIRNAYAEQGVENFYKTYGDVYRNPHESIVKECLEEIIKAYDKKENHILDLACGSGEVTSCFQNAQVVGVDPYTTKAYLNRTKKVALKYTFEDIANGALDKYMFDVIICSYALHLTEKSRLPGICAALANISSNLIIVTPNKNPIITFLWRLTSEILHKRVRVRTYSKEL